METKYRFLRYKRILDDLNKKVEKKMKSGGESTHWKPCKSSESHTMEPQDQASVHTNLPKAGLCYHKGF